MKPNFTVDQNAGESIEQEILDGFELLGISDEEQRRIIANLDSLDKIGQVYVESSEHLEVKKWDSNSTHSVNPE